MAASVISDMFTQSVYIPLKEGGRFWLKDGGGEGMSEWGSSSRNEGGCSNSKLEYFILILIMILMRGSEFFRRGVY